MPPTNSALSKPFVHNQSKGNDHTKADGQHTTRKAPEAVFNGTKAGSANMNYKEVQQDEVDVLQAIYFDGFQELGNNNAAWSVCRDRYYQ
jgi:hypothetical protein